MLDEEPQRKKRVSEGDTVEFIKTLYKSEHSVVEQLKKAAPTDLYSAPLTFLRSTPGCVVKILNESYVPDGIATKDLGQIVR